MEMSKCLFDQSRLTEIVSVQMFIDYNLYGMNMLNVAAVKFRRKDQDGE